MCGIVGYVGSKECTEVLLNSLSKLEYRGYDSAGIAVFENGEIKTRKAKGKIADLVNKMEKEGTLSGHCGIGHTRWATHGEPSDVNSHPHGNANVTIVHNGIIENYKKIKEFLVRKGYTFESETDTETVAKLLDCFYEGNPLQAIQRVIDEVEILDGELKKCIGSGVTKGDLIVSGDYITEEDQWHDGETVHVAHHNYVRSTGSVKGTVEVDPGKGDVELVFDNISIDGDTGIGINMVSGDSLKITLADGAKNSISGTPAIQTAAPLSFHGAGHYGAA